MQNKVAMQPYNFFFQLDINSERQIRLTLGELGELSKYISFNSMLLFGLQKWMEGASGRGFERMELGKSR